MDKPRVLFVYDIPDERYWKDGLWASVNLLEKDFQITRLNLALTKVDPPFPDSDWNIDFMLGWGGFNSKVDKWLSRSPFKKGLCLAGYGFPPSEEFRYDVIFYEEDWARRWMLQHSSYRSDQLVHAFGVNTDIFNRGQDDMMPIDIWDYTTVGAFSTWKRQKKLLEKPGYKLAVGQIQLNNIHESMDIITDLLLGGVCISDQVLPETLANIYRASKTIYLPAHVTGGGERSLMEARACGIDVEVESDNLKLKELLTCPVYSHFDYAKQLKSGIMSVL